MNTFNTYPSHCDLTYFKELSESLSLSRSAEKLGVGQPALSLALKRLEELMGAPLFYRRNRGLELTEAGKIFAKSANLHLNHWQEICLDFKNQKSELKGHFTIGCHPSVAIYSLAAPLNTLLTQLDQCEIKLVHGLSRNLCDQVIRGELDYAICVNPVRHPDLHIHILGTDEVAYWKSNSANNEVLIFNPLLAQSSYLLKKWKSKQPFKKYIQTDNLEVILSLAQDGIGQCILPQRVATYHKSSKLKKLSDLPAFKDEITFIYRTDIYRSDATQCLLKIFKELKL
jgi:DNA-binding transcriptional LysR family regulator